MAVNDRCPRCGALVLEQEKFCRQCGAPLNGVSADNADTGESGAVTGEPAWRPGTIPATIEALQQYCAYNHMPLQKMRFFVGVDYRQPRAFGIYREGDQFIVYKNKSDGSRAVRYHGPDEAHAVGELYFKLLDECHNRNIWPDGKPEEVVKRERKSRRRFILLVVAIIAVFVGLTAISVWHDARVHANDGYYRFDDAGIYYHYGDNWYYDDYYYDWVPMESGPYMDYDDYSEFYMGSDYEDDWGYSDFEDSRAWSDIQEEERESRTSSSDYSSWDSGDTNWDSDW